MRELEHLKKQWSDSARFRGIQANLHLDRGGLTLGAGTIVAKRNHDGSLALDDEDAKVLTLLSVAHGQAIGPSTLKTLRRASGIAREGDECKAAMTSRSRNCQEFPIRLTPRAAFSSPKD